MYVRFRARVRVLERARCRQPHDVRPLRPAVRRRGNQVCPGLGDGEFFRVGGELVFFSSLRAALRQKRQRLVDGAPLGLGGEPEDQAPPPEPRGDQELRDIVERGQEIGVLVQEPRGGLGGSRVHRRRERDALALGTETRRRGDEHGAIVRLAVRPDAPARQRVVRARRRETGVEGAPEPAHARVGVRGHVREVRGNAGARMFREGREERVGGGFAQPRAHGDVARAVLPRAQGRIQRRLVFFPSVVDVVDAVVVVVG
mmetsp:Transcript_15794/g.66565  ORF Transcript_15794/g.66565 Transcript_15794/m.66565 type:complete len:258 (-) Transcript_15794:534-1307(-)